MKICCPLTLKLVKENLLLCMSQFTFFFFKHDSIDTLQPLSMLCFVNNALVTERISKPL